MSLSMRKTIKETKLAGNSLTISLPNDKETSDFLQLIEYAKKHSGSLLTEVNDNDSSMTQAAGPMILIGNLANNKCVERLYYDFLCATDRWYPGPKGYEVRTLLDPYGTGYNVIHVGYSDSEGMNEALAYIKEQIDDSIPYQSEIHPTRLHLPDDYANHIFSDELDATKDTYFYSIRPENKGYLAYLTGNQETLNDYKKAMTEVFSMPTHHLMIYNRFVVWRLLEVTGMIDGEILERAPEFFLNWVDSEEGIGSIDKHQYQSPNLARNNHGTIPALGIKMFANYLKTYHKDIEKAEYYEELADNVYKPYFDGSWKPQCDGLCHGWWLSQPVLFHYGLLDPDKKYFKSEGARKAAECAVAVIANDGYLPAVGDSAQNRQHPGFVLRIAAAYYKDGRYKFANDILPFEFANSGEMSALARMFDIGIEPVVPNNGGTTIVPIDKLIYETWELEDDDYSSTICDTPPSDPIEKCFDKISFRSGWDKTDDFLLVDGLGGGGHSYSDAGSILEYSSNGIPFLVSEDRLTYVEPENHNQVTISRDGIRESIPAFPAIEEIKEYEDETSYLRIISRNNNGTDWTREIYFIPGIGTAIRDNIEAITPGEFSVEAHFRTPGSVLTKENGYVCIRDGKNGEKTAFVLASFDSDAEITFENKSYNHLFRTPPGKEEPDFIGLDNKRLFLRRYGINQPLITEYKSKYNKRLEKGESVVFTHFMAVATGGAKPPEAKLNDEGIVIESERGAKVLAFVNKAPENLIDFDATQPEYDFFADLLAEEGAGILCMDLKGNNIACGLASGEITMGTADGDKSWTVREDNPIYAICTDGNTLYTGMGTDTVAAYRNGVLIWESRFNRIPTMFYWWELEDQRIVSLKTDGNRIYAGCGDNYIRCFDSGGDQLWSYYYRASVPKGFEVYDIDSDGDKEIIIYGGMLSAYSQIEVIDSNGQLKYRVNEPIGAGWTSYTTAIKVFEHNGEKYIAQGVNRNKNFILYKFNRAEQQFNEVFSYKLAGAVSTLFIDKGIIYAGTSIGFLSAYDMEGNRLWLKTMNGGLRYITVTDEEIIAIEYDGVMYRLDKQGVTKLVSMDSMRATLIQEDETGIILAQAQAIYRISKERKDYEL